MAPLDGLEPTTPVMSCRVLCTLTAARAQLYSFDLTRWVLAVTHKPLVRTHKKQQKKNGVLADSVSLLAPLDGLEPTTP